ncbi:type VI secretion system Vgr family protein [Burkholderia ambifaria]|uniref:type VI secretion system Vgr family protein n=1 Tax=Burkholderia ambifaria TaxID=152480 RepID=UPI0033982E2E
MVIQPGGLGDVMARDVYDAIRRGTLQYERLLKIETPLGPNALVVQRAVGRSTLGRDYVFTLDVVSTDGAIELKKLIAQPIALWIQQANGGYRPIHGYIYTARRLGADGGLTTYQITLQAWMYLLKFRRDQRIWIDKTVEDIVSDVLNQHPEARGRFRFTLSRPTPNRSYTRQSETDWNFVHRLLESEGLYGYWEQADDGKSHTLVITDGLNALPTLSPKAISFYRSSTRDEVDAFTQWSATRSLQSVTLTTRTFDYKNPNPRSHAKGTSVPTAGNQGALPNQLEVYEYTGPYTYLEQQRGDALSRIRIEEWESRAKRFHGVGGVRAIDAGRRFELADHPAHAGDSTDQREFATIAVAWWIENNLPVSSASNFPHSLREEIANARANRSSDVSRPTPHADEGSGFFLVEVESQRVSVPYRSPFEHEKPAMHLETAMVVGPPGEEVYTDELNRIRVQFIWDRVNPGNQDASCWVRVVQADTGGGYGGVHIPRIGEEVLIDHIGGDCDRPLAMGRVYNGAARPHWHSNGLLSGYRSKEYSGAGFNQLVMDDATAQGRVQLTSSVGGSVLHLGYLIDQQGNARGAFLGRGFDLRTDAYGAVRASSGVYITTHPKSVASQPLDVRETQQQLVNAESLLESMSEVAAQHQAESLAGGQEALRTFADATHGSANGAGSGGRTAGGGTGAASAFKAPVMLFGSPAGIALSTQQSVHVASDMHMNLVSGQSTHIAAGKSLIASVANKLSLFVQNAGMKLFAAKGRVEIQAQDADVDVVAQKAVKILSATDKIEVAAAKEILLTSGGAYIRLRDGNIELHAPGKIDVKGAQHSFSGPASQSYAMPQFKPSYQAKYILQSQVDGMPMMQHPYELKLSSGRTVLGRTNDLGETIPVYTPTSQDVNLRALEQERVKIEPWKFAGGGQPDIWADYMDDPSEA